MTSFDSLLMLSTTRVLHQFLTGSISHPQCRAISPDNYSQSKKVYYKCNNDKDWYCSIKSLILLIWLLHLKYGFIIAVVHGCLKHPFLMHLLESIKIHPKCRLILPCFLLLVIPSKSSPNISIQFDIKIDAKIQLKTGRGFYSTFATQFDRHQ